MRSKEELLKIYSAYLPYELKLQHKFQEARHKGETILRSWVKPLEPLDLGCLFPDRKDYFNWKPILYSMDMLTKEIEHESKKFIPIVKWANLPIWANLKSCGYTNKRYYAYFEVENEIIKYEFPADVMSMNYYTVEFLLKYHFNVFGLEESEYIKKEDLK